jgi:hypothetical protein
MTETKFGSDTQSTEAIAVEHTLPMNEPIGATINLWQEIDLFFMQQGKVYETLQRLARNLPNAGIDYALIGGMALAVHGYVRLTQDVDLLMNEAGLEQFQRMLVGRGYVAAFPGACKMFRDTVTGVISRSGGSIDRIRWTTGNAIRDPHRAKTGIGIDCTRSTQRLG